MLVRFLDAAPALEPMLKKHWQVRVRKISPLISESEEILKILFKIANSKEKN